MSAPTLEFSQVYIEYKHKLYSYVYYRVGNQSDVTEDIVSDIFLKAYQKFDTYNDQYAISTWLYTIARNTLIDHYRAQRETVDIDEVLLADETDPLFMLIDRDISKAALDTAIAALPEKQAEYIKKQFYDRYSAKEIAAADAVSHAAVRKQVSRGVAALREALLAIVIVSASYSLYI